MGKLIGQEISKQLALRVSQGIDMFFFFTQIYSEKWKKKYIKKTEICSSVGAKEGMICGEKAQLNRSQAFSPRIGNMAKNSLGISR